MRAIVGPGPVIVTLFLFGVGKIKCGIDHFPVLQDAFEEPARVVLFYNELRFYRDVHFATQGEQARVYIEKIPPQLVDHDGYVDIAVTALFPSRMAAV